MDRFVSLADTRIAASPRHPGWVFVALMLMASSGCFDRDPMEEARALQAAGRLEESLDPLRDLLVSDPQSAEVHYRYGLALARTGKPGMAVWSLRRAQEHPEWSTRASLELGRSALASENWTTAIEAASGVLESEPENVTALEIRAEAYIGEMKRPELALEDLELAIGLAPETISLRVSQVRALIKAEKLEEAGRAMAELEPLYASSNEREKRMLGPVCALQVTFARERGEIDEAERILERCLERHAADSSVVETAIGLFDARGEPDRANVVLRAALEESPKALYYRTALGARLRVLGRTNEAEEVLRAGLGLGSAALDEGIWTALAQHYAELDDAERAADAYGEAVALSPEISEIGWLTYADVLVAAGRGEQALEVAGRLKRKHYRQLIEARLQLDQGEPERALALFDEVLVLWPDNAGARYFAARAAEQIGDFERAIEEYRQSIRADASATDAGLRYARLLLALGDAPGAWVAAGYHVRAQPQDSDGRLLMIRLALDRGGPALRAQLRELTRTAHFPAAVAMHLDSIAEREGPARAVERFGMMSLDLTQPWNALALRSYVRHLIASGDAASTRRVVSEALAAHPDEAAFHSIAGLEQELLHSGDVVSGRAEFERAVALDPNESFALEALGRVALADGDSDSASVFFDRVAKAAPSDAALQIGSTRRLEEAIASMATLESSRDRHAAFSPGFVERWRRLAREFPWEPEPLRRLAIDALGRGDSEQALELARRSVRIGGGTESWDVVARIHDARGESDLAHKARQQATRAEQGITDEKTAESEPVQAKG